MRVLLIYPKSSKELIGWGDLGAIAEPLALEYLAAGAITDSHDVRVLDLRLHPNELDHTLREFVPEVVGVTGYSMHVLRNLAICRRLKQLLPSCWTVVGGHHATLMPADFFEPEIDFVVCGEGVRPFRALLQALGGNVPVRGIPGVWSRVDGRLISGGDQPLFDIEDIPSPERSVSLGDRDAYFIDWMKPIALIRTTVGCPYRCSFCSLWKIMDGKYHKRDIERVVDELATIREECVFLVDDEPFVNGRRMMQLASAIKAAGLQKRYFAYCRIDSFLRQRELMIAWRKIGLERLFFGIEAISVKDLSDYNKRLNIAQIEAGLASARELGIEIFAQFIVNTDYTRRDFKQLVRFIKHHKISYPAFTILTPLPGTEALSTFDHVIERQPNGRPNWELFDLQHPVTKTTMCKEEFMKEYWDLRQVFMGSYTVYRGYNQNIPSGPGARPALLER